MAGDAVRRYRDGPWGESISQRFIATALNVSTRRPGAPQTLGDLGGLGGRATLAGR
jgi:hypothetical protein